MNITCPSPNCAAPFYVIRDGTFRRKDDSKIVQRFRCKICGNRFSHSTFRLSYRQKKRRVNTPLLELLASGISQRRAAILLGVNRKTIERKFLLLAQRSRLKNQRRLQQLRGKVTNIQIDDLITKENSKLKPLSVSLAVDERTRRLLCAEVSQIPAFGHLARLARKKYGPRVDRHHEGLERMFQTLELVTTKDVLIKSDEHARYPHFVRSYLPFSRHETFTSERGCVAGQGELKKVRFDPLFIINHTCAMLRANINRLVRKTWCTTKEPNRLKDHLDIFMYYYNEKLLRAPLTPI